MKVSYKKAVHCVGGEATNSHDRKTEKEGKNRQVVVVNRVSQVPGQVYIGDDHRVLLIQQNLTSSLRHRRM